MCARNLILSSDSHGIYETVILQQRAPNNFCAKVCGPSTGDSMAARAENIEGIYQTALVNYLVSLARTVEGSVNRALEALLRRDEKLASEVFLTEPRINEMEIVIDEHAIRLLRGGNLPEADVRLIVASLKVNNDLERMGDLAVNICQRVISLASMTTAENPPELQPMAAAVRAMVSKSLGALIFQNIALATEVLESDDIVDQYRDRIFESLLAGMMEDPAQVAPNMHFVLATRHLERIADHTTNIAEDIVFWVRGLDVRHGRAVRADFDQQDRGSSLQPSKNGTLNSPDPTRAE
jgi:phosphate transport system protein